MHPSYYLNQIVFRHTDLPKKMYFNKALESKPYSRKALNISIFTQPQKPDHAIAADPSTKDSLRHSTSLSFLTPASSALARLSREARSQYGIFVLAMQNDSDNVFAALSAKEANPKIKIHARGESPIQLNPGPDHSIFQATVWSSLAIVKISSAWRSSLSVNYPKAYGRNELG